MNVNNRFGYIFCIKCWLTAYSQNNLHQIHSQNYYYALAYRLIEEGDFKNCQILNTPLTWVRSSKGSIPNERLSSIFIIFETPQQPHQSKKKTHLKKPKLKNQFRTAKKGKPLDRSYFTRFCKISAIIMLLKQYHCLEQSVSKTAFAQFFQTQTLYQFIYLDTRIEQGL